MHNRRLALNSVMVIASSGLVLIISLIRGFLIPSMLSPKIYGVWQTLLLIPTYSPYSDVGVNHSMLRRIPGLSSDRDRNQIQAYRANAFWATIVLGMMISLVLISLFGIFEDVSRSTYFHAFIVIVINITFTQIHRHYSFYIRAKELFLLLSSLRVMYPLMSFVLSISLFLIIGFAGLAYGLLFANISVCIFLFYRFGLNHFGAVKSPIIIDLVKDGFLLALMPILTMTIMSLDRILIVGLYSSTDLGIYAVSAFISGLILVIPEGIATTFFPNMLRVSAIERKAVASLKDLVRMSTGWISTSSAVFIGLTYLICPSVISFFLPEYSESVGIVSILVLAYFPLGLSSTLVNALISLERKQMVIFFQIFSLIIMVICNAVAFRMEVGIIGVALSAFASIWVYYFMLILATYRELSIKNIVLLDIIKTILLLTYCVLVGVGLLAVFDNFAGTRILEIVPKLGLGCCIYFIGISPIIYRLYRSQTGLQ